MDDVTNKHISINISADRKTVWVNDQLRCLMRAQDCASVYIVDESRTEPMSPILQLKHGQTYDLRHISYVCVETNQQFLSRIFLVGGQTLRVCAIQAKLVLDAWKRYNNV